MHKGPYSHWKLKYEWDGTVELELCRNGSSANSLSRELLAELLSILRKLTTEEIPGLIIYSGKPSGFSVGADLNQFSSDLMAFIEEGQYVFQALSSCPFPSVAAINGYCLGGGCELALACTYRVAAPDAQIGFPEVKLGIHPGWGGTARLPDLVGFRALPLMIEGTPIGAQRALELGIVDALSTNLIAGARKLLYNGLHRSLLQRSIAWASNSWPARQAFAAWLHHKTSAKIRREEYPAPFKIIDLWRDYGSFKDRLAGEAASIYTLSHTETAKNLLSLYLLEQSLKRGDKSAHGIHHLHIIGDTPLAASLAVLGATRNLKVTIADNILENTSALFDQQRASPETRALLTCDLRGLRNADAVIEALEENAEEKRGLLRRIEMQVKHGALLISTSGTFTPELLSTNSSEDLVGMNFIDPTRSPLVQIPQSYEISRLVSFAKALGKLPIVVKPRPGLLINRILTPYLFEALYMYQEGMAAASIDALATQFGMPIGPLEYLDRVGLDVWAQHAREIAPILNLEIPSAMANYKHRGIGKREPCEPPLDSAASDRLILSLVCAALAANNLKIANSAELIDAAVVYGLGFPPHTGGPISYSRSLPDFDERVRSLRERYGRFETKSMDYFKLIDV